MTRPSRLAWWLLVLFFLLMTFVALSPWQQNLPGAGRVIALTPVERQQNVEAPVDGRVVKWHVIEGTRVNAGDAIVDISDNDPEIIVRYQREVDAMRARLSEARNREAAQQQAIQGLEGSRRSALDAAQSRIQMAVERVRAAERTQDAAQATLATAKLNLDRHKDLNPFGLVSTRMVELAQLGYDQAVADLDRAKASLAAASQDRAALEADRVKVENDFKTSIDTAKANLAAARQEIASSLAALQPVEVRLSRQNTQSVVAPRDGIILRLLAQPGSEMLKAGDPVAILVPESQSTVVELWVHGNDMPLIMPGDKVRIQFEGWPAVQFVGWPSVAVGTFGGIVTLVDATDNGLGKFRLLVAPDSKDQPWPARRYLRQGVRANGWVLLRQVPLWWELWRQFNGFPPSLPQEPTQSDDGAKKK
ncbi:MAG: HlyD family efflux transporter periplasmic adaptor subunit [Bryobacterales bacterium]|nr:HlyD family efflux transporter periplasmic adaptor subunit [Bryobacterales bacterium]